MSGGWGYVVALADNGLSAEVRMFGPLLVNFAALWIVVALWRQLKLALSVLS
jgi:hypothetical protein